MKTREVTGLDIGTIRRYIAITEDVANKAKLSRKDRHYTPNSVDTGQQDSPGETIEAEVVAEDGQKEPIIQTTDIINQTPINLKDHKNKLIIKKLDNISSKYLTYLDDPDENQLRKTSLKDRAVIAGILLDKKILLEHKQADVIKNQSIIFNLFGNNAELSKFITGSQIRQRKLQAREPKKYVKV